MWPVSDKAESPRTPRIPARSVGNGAAYVYGRNVKARPGQGRAWRCSRRGGATGEVPLGGSSGVGGERGEGLAVGVVDHAEAVDHRADAAEVVFHTYEALRTDSRMIAE